MSWRDKLTNSITALKDGYLNWWQSRNSREQRMLMFAVPVVLLALLYAFVYAPLSQNMSDNEVDLAVLQQQIPQLTALAGRIRELNNAGYSSSSTQRPTTANLRQIFSSHNLATTSNQFKITQQDNSFMVTIKAAPFDHLLQALTNIEKTTAAVVKQFSATAVGSGLVDVSLTLSA